MKTEVRRDFLRNRLIKSVCFLFVFLLAGQPVAACSSDYSIWQIRSKNADPLYRFIKGELAGYIDQTGKIIIEPTLDYYGNYGDEFRDGLLTIDDGKFIDKTGKTVIAKDYYRTWDFSDGLAVAMQENKGKWGYIDRTGNFVISPRFESNFNNYVYPFSDGLAMIKVNKKYGYIDRTGEFVIQPKILRGDDFSEGFARVVVEGPCVYVGDKDVCDLFNGETVGGEVKGVASPACKFTFIDKKGTIITDERFERVGNFSEGLAAVRKDGKWGFINGKGQIVIAPQFDKASEIFDTAPVFSEGLAAVKKGGLWGFIDKSGKFVIEPRFASAGNFNDGLATAGGNWNEQKSGYEDYYFINKKGEQAFPETFALASHFFKGLAHVKLKTGKTEKDKSKRAGTFAYINTEGKKVFVYERAFD